MNYSYFEMVLRFSKPFLHFYQNEMHLVDKKWTLLFIFTLIFTNWYSASSVVHCTCMTLVGMLFCLKEYIKQYSGLETYFTAKLIYTYESIQCFTHKRGSLIALLHSNIQLKWTYFTKIHKQIFTNHYLLPQAPLALLTFWNEYMYMEYKHWRYVCPKTKFAWNILIPKWFWDFQTLHYSFRRMKCTGGWQVDFYVHILFHIHKPV